MPQLIILSEITTWTWNNWIILEVLENCNVLCINQNFSAKFRILSLSLFTFIYLFPWRLTLYLWMFHVFDDRHHYEARKPGKVQGNLWPSPVCLKSFSCTTWVIFAYEFFLDVLHRTQKHSINKMKSSMKCEKQGLHGQPTNIRRLLVDLSTYEWLIKCYYFVQHKTHCSKKRQKWNLMAEHRCDAKH